MEKIVYYAFIVVILSWLYLGRSNEPEFVFNYTREHEMATLGKALIVGWTGYVKIQYFRNCRALYWDLLSRNTLFARYHAAISARTWYFISPLINNKLSIIISIKKTPLIINSVVLARNKIQEEAKILQNSTFSVKNIISGVF